MNPSPRDAGPGSNGRTPPHDLALERGLLGGAIGSPRVLEALVATTKPGDFYRPSHRRVAEVLAELYAAGVPVDAPLLWHELTARNAAGGLEQRDLVEWLSSGCASTAGEQYARKVHDLATLRRAIRLGDEMAERGYTALDPVEVVQWARSTIDEDLGDALAGGAKLLQVVNLAELGDVEPEEPTIGRRTDGKLLVYSGRLNAVYSEPSIGKTWVALAWIAEVVRIGGAAIYLDLEDTPRGIGSRLHALGLTPDELARVPYVNLPDGFGEQQRAELAPLLDQLCPDLVVIDGVAEALSREGLSEDKANEVLPWLDRFPRWIAARGAAVVMLDHVSKDREQRGRHARGSGAKLGAIDGAAYGLTLLEPYARARAGSIKLETMKDRNGGVGPIGDTAAVAKIEPQDDGRTVTVRFIPPEQSGAGQHGEPFRPTRIMAAVSEQLERAGKPLRESTLRSLLAQFKRTNLEQAIARLSLEGYITETKDGRAKAWRIVKPYEEGDGPGPGQHRDPDLFDSGEVLDDEGEPIPRHDPRHPDYF